ncbi:unnamed protein product [Macrosiphum euphorbiae]|uniref:Uncharacterized protein n=1 Tax=Macrosiphum euphorbiae TaxID=13131 RepID=A0AAV0WRW9_9HEMI|nr:unnamed protein product [Macrosiphum euphorbiae]
MGNHRGGTRRKKTDSPAHMQLRHRDAPQRPEPKSPTPSSASTNTEDSLSTDSSSDSFSPESMKHTEDANNTRRFYKGIKNKNTSHHTQSRSMENQCSKNHA